MNKYTFEVTIEAAGQMDARMKLQAASVLIKKLKLHEISKLAEVVEKDPVKMAIARQALGL